MRIVDYMDPEHGFFAQYCGRLSGSYPGMCRASRRAAEIAAHAAGVRQAETFEHAGNWVLQAYRNNAEIRLAGPKMATPTRPEFSNPS